MSAVVKVERVQLPLPREATKSVVGIKISDRTGRKVVRLVEHQVGYAIAHRMLGDAVRIFAKANWDKNLQAWMVVNPTAPQEW